MLRRPATTAPRATTAPTIPMAAPAPASIPAQPARPAPRNREPPAWAPVATASFSLLTLAAIAVLIAACSGRQLRLPRPPPLAVHTGEGLSPAELQQLADIRRFAAPHRQLLLERTLTHLETDPRLPAAAGTAALRRALAAFDPGGEFCDQLRAELRPLVLSGPAVPDEQTPERVALAVSIDRAHAAWLRPEARRRYPKPLDLARAIRDRTLAADATRPDFPLGAAGRPLFVTAATALEGKGPSAAGRLCLPGKPAASYVVAVIPRGALRAPLRVPTAADGACRPRFRPAPGGSPAGRTCSGRPEYVTAPLPLSAAETLRLSR